MEKIDTIEKINKLSHLIKESSKIINSLECEGHEVKLMAYSGRDDKTVIDLSVSNKLFQSSYFPDKKTDSSTV